ncbi:MAG: DNA-3-methyladenine glycosylase 2 family protein [Candidatus Kapaibacterium sp.]
MKLDPEACYRAVVARDRRFDGRFFTAVTTTGIYCRPICPARTPLLRNIRFFSCPAAAEESGFRPCLRCHPESSPGTPAWSGTAATVSRALRLIAEGALDRGGVDDLAVRMGVGSRHLRRLFQEHLGASPNAIAVTRRVHLARTLIEQTPLPLADVAFCAGFASTRRFNAAFRATFGRAPGEFRRGKGVHRATLTVKLAYRPPFDWEAMIGFLGARAIPGVEMIAAGHYRRTVAAGEIAGVIDVSPVAGEPNLLVSIPWELARNIDPILEGVRRLFDLRADPEAIASHLAYDPALLPRLHAHPGLRVPGAWSGFELAVRAILGQQVSVKGATTLAGRLVSTFGRPMPSAAGEPGMLFPRPEDLRAAPVETIGLPEQRAVAIRELAAAVSDGRLDFGKGSSLEEIIAQLLLLPGIGPWTAHYIAMRAFGEPDAFPAGDLVLRREAAFGGTVLSERELLERGKIWSPWRAYAIMYLWAGDGADHEQEEHQ